MTFDEYKKAVDDKYNSEFTHEEVSPGHYESYCGDFDVVRFNTGNWRVSHGVSNEGRGDSLFAASIAFSNAAKRSAEYYEELIHAYQEL